MSSRGARTTLAAGVLASVIAPVWAPPAAAAEQQCSVDAVPGTEPLAPADPEDNPVHDRIGVTDAHRLVRGRGTRVAVIDSGIVPADGMQGERLFDLPGTSAAIKSGHGTIVAGLIAGEYGVAPQATVYDVKVFDAEVIDPSEGEELTSAGIEAGIRAVIEAWPEHRFDVVNISLAVPTNDPRLEAAVAELVALDTVVVAAAGNRTEEGEGFAGTPGSDDTVYPADYPGVVGVSAVPPGDESPAAYVAPNRDTDVAAPTAGAASFNATGQACIVPDVKTSWATAEVSGVVALLRQRFPRDTAAQTIARLKYTAEGAGTQVGLKPANPWTGAGVVQAHDALTHEVRLGRQGRAQVSEPAVGADAQAPPAPQRVDLFGSSRALLLWTGLLAGALLALAFLLRPLIRPSSR